MTVYGLARNDVPGALRWLRGAVPVRPEDLEILARLQDDPAELRAGILALRAELGRQLTAPDRGELGARPMGLR